MGRDFTSKSWGSSGGKKVAWRSSPAPANRYLGCRGVTPTDSCCIASSTGRRKLRIDAPIHRYVCPSIRARPVIGCALSDQCFVGASVRASAIDQRLKNGSFAASGTAGGRCCCAKQQGKEETIVQASNSFSRRHIDRTHL